MAYGVYGGSFYNIQGASKMVKILLAIFGLLLANTNFDSLSIVSGILVVASSILAFIVVLEDHAINNKRKSTKIKDKQ